MCGGGNSNKVDKCFKCGANDWKFVMVTSNHTVEECRKCGYNQSN